MHHLHLRWKLSAEDTSPDTKKQDLEPKNKSIGSNLEFFVRYATHMQCRRGNTQYNTASEWCDKLQHSRYNQQSIESVNTIYCASGFVEYNGNAQLCVDRQWAPAELHKQWCELQWLTASVIIMGTF